MGYPPSLLHCMVVSTMYKSTLQAILKGSQLVKPQTGLGPSIMLNQLYQLDDLAAWQFSDADICGTCSLWC